MKAFLHVHTTFSYDGEVSLEEVVKSARSLGAGVVFLNEHLKGMTRNAYGELVRRARSLSDGGMAVVPGLEVKLPDGGDLLAAGVGGLPRSGDMCSLADEIHEMGGVAILAHPDEARGISPAGFRALDGIEVWNGLHDSKYFPNGAGLALLKRGRAHNSNLFGCCGLDLHKKDDWFPLYLSMEARQGGGLLAALRSGAFSYGRKNLKFGAEWAPNMPASAALTALTCAYKACALGLRKTSCSLPRFMSGAMRRLTGER
ncbi:MAG: PHP domain-containing protein [Candidatus Tritonobacter lacicola]|nr:PHP domain-containing protein [Candidatus Tritonobacter lacicola]